MKEIIAKYANRYDTDESIKSILNAIANDTPFTNDINWESFRNEGISNKLGLLNEIKLAAEALKEDHTLVLREQMEAAKAKNRYLKSLFSSLELQNKDYDKVVRLIDSTTLPIISSTDQPIKAMAIGASSLGYLNTSYSYLSNGEATPTNTFFFENYDEEECVLEIVLEMNGLPVNSIELDFFEDDIVKKPVVESVSINSLRMSFSKLENIIYFNPKYADRISIVCRQKDVSSYENLLRKVMGIEGIKVRLNQYASEYSYNIEKNTRNFLAYKVDPIVDRNSKIADIVLVEGYTIDNDKVYPLSTIIGNSQLSTIKGIVSIKRNDELLKGQSIDRSEELTFESQAISRLENDTVIITLGSMAEAPYIYETSLIDRSTSNVTSIGKGTGETNFAVGLPIQLNPQELSSLKVTVNGIEWLRVDDIDQMGPRDLSWEWRSGKIYFGDGTNGASVPPMGIIAVRMDPEAVAVKKEEDLYYLQPRFYFDPDINTMDLRYVTDEVSSNKKVLNRMSLVHKLDPNIVSGSIKARVTDLNGTPLTGVIGTEQDFANGKKELLTDGDWSVDYENGYLYLKLSIKGDERATVSYQYHKIENCGDTLKYEDGKLRLTKLKTKSVEDYLSNNPYKVSSTGKTYLEELNGPGEADGYILSNRGILEGTIDLSNFFTNTSWPSVEVPFVNGRWEIRGISQVEEMTSSFVGIGTHSFTIQNHVKLHETGDFSFEVGDYFVNLETSVGDVNSLGSYFISEDGVVTFYYNEPAKVLKPFKYSYLIKTSIEKDINIFSVDYDEGVLYTLAELVSTDSNASVRYKAANYFLSYRIVNPLPLSTWNKNQYSFNGSKLINRNTKVKAMFKEVNPEQLTEEYRYYSPIIKDILLCLA